MKAKASCRWTLADGQKIGEVLSAKPAKVNALLLKKLG
jgi:hypothetical protein